jgi:superfamily II DNA/RNA helicase
LRELLEGAEDLQNAIVFCNRKRDISTLFRSLERHEYNVGALHGDMDQRTRMMMLDNFRKGAIKLLVASDVAARGLDIPEVSHVFNYDVPINAEDYVHRIGRTGRAGRSGTAYTLVTESDQKYLRAIEELTNQSIEWVGESIDFEAAAAERKAKRRSSKTSKADSSNDNDAAQSKPAPKNRGQSRRKTEEPAPETPVEETRPTSRVQKISQKPANKSQKQDNNAPAFSEGVHIPAFLLRDPRAKNAS